MVFLVPLRRKLHFSAAPSNFKTQRNKTLKRIDRRYLRGGTLLSTPSVSDRQTLVTCRDSARSSGLFCGEYFILLNSWCFFEINLEDMPNVKKESSLSLQRISVGNSVLSLEVMWSLRDTVGLSVSGGINVWRGTGLGRILPINHVESGAGRG